LYNNCHRIDDERTGEPVGVGTVMRDMRPELNARTYLEEQVRERTRELTDLNRQLEQKNKDLTSFAFVSSHDLQEPLRKINTYISRIEENGLKGDYSRNAEFFERIKTSVSRMQRLISDLLLFSKTNISDELFEQVDLSQLLTEVAEEFKEGLTLSTAEIHADVLPVLSAVPFQVKQLFSNLLSNAIKFARPDLPLKLTISASTTDKIPGLLIDQRSFYCIAFADNGIGFDNEFSERIFDVFQRLHSKDAYEGTGVGLSICKRIMEHHRGHIRAKGDPGTGAVFYLYFPAA
jgi:light-regulated signal transduction histidine kinase (bacteriophytochrome)